MNRLRLHTVLTELFPEVSIYFQPPSNINLDFPAIVYNFESDRSFRSDNAKYLRVERYNVVLMTRELESDMVNTLLNHPKFTFSNRYTNGTVHHFAFKYSV